MGFALAQRFARGGATVVCIEAIGEQPDGGHDTRIVSATILKQVVQEVKAIGNGRALTFGIDPEDPKAWERAVDGTIDQLRRIDIACAFMGTTGPKTGDGPLLDVTLDSWQRCYDVNVVAPLLFGRACAADMVRRGEGAFSVSPLRTQPSCRQRATAPSPQPAPLLTGSSRSWRLNSEDTISA